MSKSILPASGSATGTPSLETLGRILVVVTPLLSAAMLALIGVAIRSLLREERPKPAETAGPWHLDPRTRGYRPELRSVSPVGAPDPHSPPTPPFGVRRVDR